MSFLPIMVPGFMLQAAGLGALETPVNQPLMEDGSQESRNSAPPVPTESRRLALETAGAFENEGFRIRDGEWHNSLSKGKEVFLQVNLFAGNQYWFVAASAGNSQKMRIVAFDTSGKPIQGESWQDGGAHPRSRTALGVAPAVSGVYFLAVELLDTPGTSPVDVSLVYAYK
jgi:hypothetical protein